MSASANPARQASGFTLIELIVVIAIIGMLASVVFALLSDAQRDAKDKRRISDLQQIQTALELYYIDHQSYPRESEGVNGNTATNDTFGDAIDQYLSGLPRDPASSVTFHYYYDGSHRCGSRYVAIIFARQMEKSTNANYQEFLTTTCGGIVDGEGRGGGEESYNLILGESGG